METAQAPITDAEKLRKLPWGLAEGLTNSVFAQLTVFGSAFILFLDELGLQKTQIGVLLSLLPFCGLLSLLTAPAIARIGVKRVFVACWGMRKVVILLLLLVPFVRSRFGTRSAFLFLTATVLLFAVLRSIAETASLPWYQEYVPSSVQGKYSAVNYILGSLSSALAVVFSGVVLGLSSSINRFLLLFAIGAVFGFASVACALFIPGGHPVRRAYSSRAHLSRLIETLRDARYARFLAGMGLVVFATTAWSTFLPLFLTEKAGFSSRSAVLIQTWTMVGGILSSYLFGWVADRARSRQVLLAGLLILLLLPLIWLLAPRETVAGLVLLNAAAVLLGVGSIAWTVGSNTLLFVSIVPPEKKTEYLALYYAWIGLIGGISPIAMGRMLDYSRAISGRFLGFPLDAYTPFFVLHFFLMAGAVLFLRKGGGESRSLPPPLDPPKGGNL